MSSDVVLRVDDLAKTFRLYRRQMHRVMQVLSLGRRQYYDEFQAVKGVSFEVERGQTLGIIGRNGSGKSTLLQMICGTLTPTRGLVSVDGRIGALLELGAGFNPEFTGRENIYVNAALMGLSRTEVDHRLDEIVAFSELEAFIDQPVKTYSSGMYVRLAFSVIAHLDVDLLVVDEALAVGDALFQAKCNNRIRHLIAQGTSLLFVSHDLGATKALCNKAILLDHGTMLAYGETGRVADRYVDLLNDTRDGGGNAIEHEDEGRRLFERRAALGREGKKRALYLDAVTLDTAGRRTETFRRGDDMVLRTVVRAEEPLGAVGLGVHLRDRNGVDVAYADNLLAHEVLRNAEAGACYEVEWTIPLPLASGRYDIAIVASALQADAPNTDRPRSEDFVLCDFVPVAAQIHVWAETAVHGYVHLPTDLRVRRLDPAEAADASLGPSPEEKALS